MKDCFENALEKFEQEFNQGNQPEIQQFLDSQVGNDAEFLSELVHTELELRLRNGESVRVEYYLDQFPELADDPAVLRELIRTEYNTRRNFDPACRLEEFIVRFPDLRQSLIDEFLNLSVDARQTDTVIKQVRGSIAIAPASHSETANRFRKQKLHEQGGLGNVWIAEDNEFEREVALKEIKSKYANSQPHHARFARESKIMGSLEHPGIVPVYGQGHSLDGTPFFAMQFIQGKNLRDSISEFHRPTVDQQTGNPQESILFNRLLQHFVDACNTIEYAHSQQVIHRDIKPSNIMVGQFGETYLIDWGLACKMNSPETNSAKIPQQKFDDHLLNANQTLSLDGQAIGSPAYMSPEQAQGNTGHFDHATDVYGLGATLLALVTGCENPNREMENIESNQNGHAQSSHSSLQPLVSICRKAMAQDHEQRYKSVKSLREDVENFLIDKPMEAHQESVFGRMNRFLRQNRVLLNAALVSLVLISLVSSVAAFWINNERQNAVAARESESKLKQSESIARQKAEQRTEQLTNVIGLFSDALSGTDDAGLQIEPEKRTAKEIISELEQRISESDNPIAQAFLSTVVARNDRASADYDKAERTYRNAIDLLDKEGIKVTDPLYADLLFGLTATLLATGKMDEAEQNLETLKLAYQDSPEPLAQTYFRSLLANVKIAIHNLDLDQALSLSNQARKLGREIYADSPNHDNKAWADYVLAGVHRKRGQLAEAAKMFEQVIETQNCKQTLHATGISAAVQLSELRQKSNPKQSLALIEQARKDSAAYFGPDHSDTLNIDARYGVMLVNQADEDSKNRGIEILERCLEIKLDRLGTANRDSLGTTILLTQSLLSLDNLSKTRRAIDILEKTLTSLDTPEASQNFAGYTASFYDKLSTANDKIGDRDKATDVMTQAVQWAIKAFGKESHVVNQLQKKLDDLLANQ